MLQVLDVVRHHRGLDHPGQPVARRFGEFLAGGVTADAIEVAPHEDLAGRDAFRNFVEDRLVAAVLEEVGHRPENKMVIIRFHRTHDDAVQGVQLGQNGVRGVPCHAEGEKFVVVIVQGVAEQGVDHLLGGPPATDGGLGDFPAVADQVLEEAVFFGAAEVDHLLEFALQRKVIVQELSQNQVAHPRGDLVAIDN